MVVMVVVVVAVVAAAAVTVTVVVDGWVCGGAPLPASRLVRFVFWWRQ